MTSIPLVLPLKAQETAALADIVYGQVEGKPLTEDLRNRFASRLAPLALQTFTPFPGSLQQDPIHPSTYYIAVDALGEEASVPLLLRIAGASSPASGLFPGALLIARFRAGDGREIVINAIPFAPADHENLRTFAEKVDRAVLPRPRGAQSAIAAPGSLCAAFQAFRDILKSTGANLASIAADYHSGLWAAIRAGWRSGYNSEAAPFVVAGTTDDEIRRSLEAAKRGIDAAADYTKFSVDTSQLLESPRGVEVDDRFDRIFSLDEQMSLESEFPQLDQSALRLTAVKFGRGLKMNEEIYDHIATIKGRQSSWKHFDFELSLDGGDAPATPEELFFCLHWWKARGRTAQLIAPGPSERLNELAEVARQFNATLSIASNGGQTHSALEEIGRATGGRFHYKISREELDRPPEEVRDYVRTIGSRLLGKSAPV